MKKGSVRNNVFSDENRKTLFNGEDACFQSCNCFLSSLQQFYPDKKKQTFQGGWGADNEDSLPIGSVDALLRCDDDYETRYGTTDHPDAVYPYDVNKSWNIALPELHNVVMYTHGLKLAAENGSQKYNILTNNCVHKAVGAIKAEGITFSVPDTHVVITRWGFTILDGYFPTPGGFGQALLAAGGTSLYETGGN